ncbi:hypothetical protein OUZ56_011297 [Daphnia magna]|uniref:Uncharacterized protein n=1 Tax=Daphnia magna TaxID=35525 RepID=A0ABQ9YZR5_9CRUS|nr:hypothetical protein OUZ56_011297 [Daphnia magna]
MTEQPNFLSLGSMIVSNARLFSNRFGRAQLMALLQHLKNLNRYGGVTDDSFVCKSLPSSKDIEETVLEALKDAEEKLNALGIRVDGGDPFGFDSRLAWKPNVFSIIDSNENIDDECEETNCAVLEDVVDSVDDDFDDFDASVRSSISNGNFNDYTSLLEKACLKSQQRLPIYLKKTLQGKTRTSLVRLPL